MGGGWRRYAQCSYYGKNVCLITHLKKFEIFRYEVCIFVQNRCSPKDFSREYSMNYRRGFLSVVWFSSYPPLPSPTLPSEGSTGDTQEDWERKTCREERSGEGALSYDGDKAWSSLNHSILSSFSHTGLYTVSHPIIYCIYTCTSKPHSLWSRNCIPGRSLRFRQKTSEIRGGKALYGCSMRKEGASRKGC